MDTKYGKLSSDSFSNYRKSMVDRIWLLIPLKEEQCPTLQNYIERINRELFGMLKFIQNHDEYVFSTICLLENLISIEDFDTYKHDVFRCCDLISKAYGGDSDV